MRNIFKLLIATFLFFMAGTLFASEVGGLGTILGIAKPFLEDLIVKYPAIGNVIGYMILARIFLKPVQTFLSALNKRAKEQGHEINPLQKLEDYSSSKIYSTVVFFIDWLFSVKLPKKDK